MRHITRCDGINSIFKFRQIFLFRWLVAVFAGAIFRYGLLSTSLDSAAPILSRSCRTMWPCLAHKTHIATWIVMLLLAYENFTMWKCWMIMCDATLCANAKRCFSTMCTSYLWISPTYEQIHVWVCVSHQNHRGIWLRWGMVTKNSECTATTGVRLCCYCYERIFRFCVYIKISLARSSFKFVSFWWCFMRLSFLFCTKHHVFFIAEPQRVHLPLTGIRRTLSFPQNRLKTRSIGKLRAHYTMW